MTRIASPRAIVAAYLLAVAALSAAMLFAMSSGGAVSTSTVRVGVAIAAILVLASTFAWGGRRGFHVKDPDGRISITNVLRNLVMSVIMAGVVIFVVSQVIFWTVKITD